MSLTSGRILDLAMEIQQIPAPTFEERARGEFICARFRNEPLEEVSIDELGNVSACLRGKARGFPPLVISAHLDTVFPAGTDLRAAEESGKIIAPGIGDNSLGVAALMGIAWGFQERGIDLERDLWLVANVGEEGLGDLRGMRAVVERFGRQVAGYLVLEGLALGQVYHRGVGVQRYRIRASTSGGHSWSDHGRPSAVHQIASLVTRLSSIRLPREPRATLNVGTIGGGVGVNVIASDAFCELDLRAEDPAELARLVQQVDLLVQRANQPGVRMEAQSIGRRPGGEVPADHPFVRAAVESLHRSGVEAALTSGSTDANIPLSLGIPSVVLGVTTGGGAHTLREHIDTAPVERGMHSLLDFVGSICR
jgi:acetylornithine deacetylase/succinyl-diaminopimelate desuccinylase-like protein